MKYYVWLEYYAGAPVSKNIKSEELKYADKHEHGVQPSQTQVNGLQTPLTNNVTAAYATYNRLHPQNPQVGPTTGVITAGRIVKTRSEK